MKYHPATQMLFVWGTILLLYFILPLQYHGRSLSLYGFTVLIGFIAAFMGGSLLAARPVAGQAQPIRDVEVDFRRTDRMLKWVSAISLATFTVELSRRNFLNLGESHFERSSRAEALMNGLESGASVAFQIGFMLYPAAIIWIARTVGFDRRINMRDLLIFGVFPTIAFSLAVGGRSPIFYAMAIFLLALGVRKRLLGKEFVPQFGSGTLALYIVIGIIGIFAVNYFSQVFLARAEATGGVVIAFNNAALNWGVSLDPDWYNFLMSTIGEANTFLLLSFSWYLIQGVVIVSEIFTYYTGGATFGAYGTDLGGAIARRVDPMFLSTRFLGLLDLNIYGFLPTAFGSAYIDFGGLSPVFVGIWGYLSGLVYKHAHLGRDPRWLLIAPFVVFGILFSIVNTPLGFANGLMVHFWLIAAFMLARVRILQNHQSLRSENART